MTMTQGSLCPLAPMRFLCDEMLIGLAQWLRIAGYDTALPPQGAPDRQLVEQARTQQRWLITADADLLSFACAPFYVVYLSGRDEEARLRELTLLLDLDWCFAPFTRCKNCNTALRIARARERTAFSPTVPSDIPEPVLACTQCRQLFWAGSHVGRMRSKLEAMNRWREASG